MSRNWLGRWKVLPVKSPSVLALRYDWRGSSLLTLHNFDRQPHQVEIRPGVKGGEVLIDLFEENRSEANAKGVHKISLEAHGRRWFRVGTANYALCRQKS